MNGALNKIRTHSCRFVSLAFKPLHHQKNPYECPIYNTKQSNGETPVMLEHWGMPSIPSLPSLPGPLGPGVIRPDRVFSIGQIELFDF